MKDYKKNGREVSEIVFCNGVYGCGWKRMSKTNHKVTLELLGLG